MVTQRPYPVRIEARLDEPLSRWLWLVKWLLAIPHYVVLLFLGVAFLLTTVVAFFAILFTGRYPRGIFDFNVGVMRWGWRVSYYGYGALGTDRYPPFSLEDDPDYPARLEVDYPEHLSRGLVLVKWWLLAIPHYIIIGLLAGGGWAVLRSRGWEIGGGGGLIQILVIVAAIALTFSGSYPRSLFDLVLGLDRWVARVVGYAALMTDEYPPFRLDMGESEAGAIPPPPPGAVPPEPGVTTARSGWTAGRVIALIVGALMVLVSLAFLTGGGIALWADKTQRDDEGFVTSSRQGLATSTYALTVEGIDLRGSEPRWVFPGRILGDVRVRAEDRSGDGSIFVGIARTRDVDSYLGSVAHATVTDLFDRDAIARTGGPPDGPPDNRTFWAASASGPGLQSAVWDAAPGSWSIVVMNEDASKGVAIDGDIGATVPALVWVAIGLLVAGGILLLGGVAFMVGAIRRVSRPAA